MEGVGARLGRSSTRYGPAAVFSGPVRKWKKTWVHVSSSHSNHASHHPNTANSHNSSHLLLYKWTPISQSSNTNNNSGIKDDDAASAAAAITTEEPLRRKIRYVPVFVIEEQKKESAGDDDEDKGDTAMTDAQMTSRNSDGTDRKPDVNDMPMDETQVSNKDQEAAQGPSETSLDLNLA